jgi:mannose-1-phosphate guanylyltransferase
VSVERETFPGLLAAGHAVHGYVDASYWLDLGTPAAFVRGSCDLVSGLAPTAALPGPVGDAIVLPEARVAPDALVTGGTTVGRRAAVGGGCVVEASVLFDDVELGDGARVVRSVVGAGARIGAGALVRDAVVGDGAVVGAGCELSDGIRVWPGHVLPAGSVRFSPA